MPSFGCQFPSATWRRLWFCPAVPAGSFGAQKLGSNGDVLSVSCTLFAGACASACRHARFAQENLCPRKHVGNPRSIQWPQQTGIRQRGYWHLCPPTDWDGRLMWSLWSSWPCWALHPATGLCRLPRPLRPRSHPQQNVRSCPSHRGRKNDELSGSFHEAGPGAATPESGPMGFTGPPRWLMEDP